MSIKNIPFIHLELEVWKPVFGFEGLYEVSNMCRVKSLERRSFNGKYAIREKILRHGVHKSGYLKYTLCKDGKFNYVNIHNLIAKAFIPNPNNYPCINHIDNNPKNNKIENLEWCTFSHNTLHAYKTGRLNKHGERNHMNKLKQEQVLEVFRLNMNRKKIAEKFKISVQTVNDIKAKRRWAWLLNDVK